MLNRFLLVLCVLFSFNAYAHERGVQVAVDGSPITETDINKRSKLIILSSGLPDNKNSYQMIRARVIEILIDERLVEKDAEQLKIEVSEEDVAEGMMTIADRNGIDRSKFMEEFKKKGLDITELELQLKHQIMWSKILASKIQPTISVTSKEVDENRASIERAAKAETEVAELKLAEIVLFNQKESDIEKNRAFMNKIVSRIREGADFGSLSREFSQGPSAKSFGEIGWIASNQMHPSISRALMKVQVGSTTEPMVMPDAVRIFKLLDKKIISAEEQSLTDSDIENVIMEKKTDVGIKSYLRKLRQKSHIQYY
jgi:peptidyl-prolyl cis-trans isomerase SurA